MANGNSGQRGIAESGSSRPSTLMIDITGDLVWDLPCVQQASYLEGGLLVWMLPLYLHVNQKSNNEWWWMKMVGVKLNGFIYREDIPVKIVFASLLKKGVDPRFRVDPFSERAWCVSKQIVVTLLKIYNLYMSPLTLVLLNPDISYLCKQCRSRSVGFWRSPLIWICTVCHSVCEFISTIWIK